MELIDRKDLLAKISALWTIKPNNGTELIVKSSVEAVIGKQWNFSAPDRDPDVLISDVICKKEIEAVVLRAWVVFPPADTDLPKDLELVLRSEIISEIKDVEGPQESRGEK